MNPIFNSPFKNFDQNFFNFEKNIEESFKKNFDTMK